MKKYIFAAFLVFSTVNTVFSQDDCQACRMGNRGRNPSNNQKIPPPAPNNTTLKGDKGDPGIPGQMGPQGLAGIPGKNGTDGKPGKDGVNGKDGKDADPTILNGIQEQLAKLNGQLQSNQESYVQINKKLSDLQASLDATTSKFNEYDSKISTVSNQVNSLTQKLAGQLRVKFTYDPKTGSLTPSN